VACPYTPISPPLLPLVASTPPPAHLHQRRAQNLVALGLTEPDAIQAADADATRHAESSHAER